MVNTELKDAIDNELANVLSSKCVDWNMVKVDNQDIIIVKQVDNKMIKYSLFSPAMLNGKFITIIKII
jgi:hypothetical protein